MQTSILKIVKYVTVLVGVGVGGQKHYLIALFISSHMLLLQHTPAIPGTLSHLCVLPGL